MKNNKATHHIIKFYPDHISLVNYYTEAFEALYNYKPKLIRHPKFFSLITYSKSITQDLSKIGEFGKLSWRAPFKLFNTKESKKEWLKAIYDCEGYVGQKQIKIQTVNRNGILDIQKLLQRLLLSKQERY